MKTRSVRRRVRQLEAEGKAVEAVALLETEMKATTTVKSPTETITAPDHRRQLQAVRVALGLKKRG